MTSSTFEPTEGTRQISAQITRFVRGLKSLQLQAQHRSRHGVDPSAYPVLFQLVERPRRTSELATCLHADISTVSRQVTGLVDLGLVERRADPDDKRATILAATAAGQAAYDDMTDARERMFGRVVADWPDDDVEALVRLLHRFNDRFDEVRQDLLAEFAAEPASPTATPTSNSTA